MISSEAERLARIVNDILWTSRIESGGLQVTIERCDAVELAERRRPGAAAPAAGERRPRAPRRNGVTELAADPDKVRQVLANLVDNAVKYSPDGGVVELRLERGGRPRPLRRRGRGARHPRRPSTSAIFEKFYRLDPDLTRGVGGTGLGLYICRELVRRMNGRIWVEGRDGPGSLLRRRAAAGVEGAGQPADADPATSTRGDRRRPGRPRRTRCGAGRRRPGRPRSTRTCIESRKPTTPTTIRITPTTWMSTPETVASTAQVRMAPVAIRIRLTPKPMVPPDSCSCVTCGGRGDNAAGGGSDAPRPIGSRPVRRGAIISLVAIGGRRRRRHDGRRGPHRLAAGAGVGAARGHRLHLLADDGICIAIFAIVGAVILYSVWKFRAQPDDDSDGPPIHGHTGLEIVVDGDPDGARDRDRRRERGRARAERRAPARTRCASR